MPTSGTASRFTWAIRPSTATRDIRLTVNGVTATVQLATAGPYHWRGDGTTADACVWLDAALSSHAQAPGVTVALATDGKLTVTMTKSFAILWGDALTTADPAWFGEVVPATWTGLVVGPNWAYTHTRAAGHAWFPGEWYDDDSGSEPGNQLARAETLAGRVDVYRWSGRAVRRIAVSFLPAERVFAAEATTGESFADLHAAMASGEYLEWTPDVAAPSVWAQWSIADEEWIAGWPMARPIDKFARYSVELPLIAYVP